MDSLLISYIMFYALLTKIIEVNRSLRNKVIKIWNP